MDCTQEANPQVVVDVDPPAGGQATGNPEQQVMTKQGFMLVYPLREGLDSKRDYHSHWSHCWGDCDQIGWAACCLSCCFPCVAMG